MTTVTTANLANTKTMTSAAEAFVKAFKGHWSILQPPATGEGPNDRPAVRLKLDMQAGVPVLAVRDMLWVGLRDKLPGHVWQNPGEDGYTITFGKDLPAAQREAHLDKINKALDTSFQLNDFRFESQGIAQAK